MFLGNPKDSGREDWGTLGNIRCGFHSMNSIVHEAWLYKPRFVPTLPCGSRVGHKWPTCVTLATWCEKVADRLVRQ